MQFVTNVSRIVAADTNDVSDIYLRDRTLRTTTLVSINQGAAFGSWGGQISANGRYVTFETPASLIPADQAGQTDYYWKDLQTGTVKLASTGNLWGWTESPTISGDGRYVAFLGFTPVGPVPGGSWQGTVATYLSDTTTGSLAVISTKTGGAPSTSRCEHLSLSHNGRIAGMVCNGGDIVPGMPNDGSGYAILKELDTNTSRLVSRIPNGAFGSAGGVVLTRDGSQVLLHSSFQFTSPDNNGTTDVFVASRQ